MQFYCRSNREPWRMCEQGKGVIWTMFVKHPLTSAMGNKSCWGRNRGDRRLVRGCPRV